MMDINTSGKEAKTSFASCDLVEDSKRHKTFLQTLHKEGITLKKPTDQTLHRYSKLWLPLVHRHYLDCTKEEDPNETPGLVPPPDIAWLWHCHRLAPYRYARYVQATFFPDSSSSSSSEQEDLLVLDPAFPFSFQLKEGSANPTINDEKACTYTQSLWAEMYPEESFFSKSSEDDLLTASANTLNGFDIVESCQCQAGFLWQICAGNFNDDVFLQQGIANYTKFVSLMGSKSRPKFLVPTYQIDLMWHTHMLSSIASYHKDCIRLVGMTLEHDDSLNDRAEGAALDVNFRATSSLWKDVYGEEYKVVGGMYRGEPPKAYYTSEWAAHHSKAHILPGLSFAHLAGIAGASSVGFVVNNQTSWRSIDERGMFIEGDTGRNEKKDNYVFGDGTKGRGFYHFHTREAYDVLLSRVNKAINHAKISINGLCCMMMIAPYCIPCLCCTKSQTKKKLKELEDMRAVIESRRAAAGPETNLDIPEDLKKRLERRRNGNDGDYAGAGADTGYYYYSDPNYMNNYDYYGGGGDAGGGCGSGADGGGGGGGDGGGGCDGCFD